MGGTIGDIEFEFDLYWKGRFTPWAQLGNASAVTINGDKIRVFVCSDHLTHTKKGTLKVSWCTQEQLDALRALAESRAPFTVKPSEEEAEFTAIFDGDDAITATPIVEEFDGFAHGQIGGTSPINLYSGELRIEAREGYPGAP